MSSANPVRGEAAVAGHILRPTFTALVAADMARWAQIVREAGIKAD